MTKKIFGYIRVSTKEQNADRQVIALSEFDIPSQNIFTDKQSGKDFNRKAYNRMMKKLKKGDLLIVKSIDRLGRNYQEIIEQWRILTREKGVDIKILDMPLLDTTFGKDLLGTFISDLVLQVMSFVAENEREQIRKRQAEGIAAAKARGVHFGNREKPLPDNFSELYEKRQSGELTFAELADLCGMCRSSLSKKLREYQLASQIPATVRDV